MNFLKQLSTTVTGATIIASVTAMSALSSKAATIVFSDSTFNDEDWKVTSFLRGNGRVITGNQITSGDNQFRQIINTSDSDPRMTSYTIGFHQQIGAVYNPQLQGAISSLDYSENSILFGGYYNGQTTGVALTQDGKVYAFGVGVTPERNWTTKSVNNLQESDFSLVGKVAQDLDLPSTVAPVDFGSGTERPDFSSTGTPIEFGFFRSNTTCPTCGSYRIVAGIDNWSVTIKTEEPEKGSTPEPSSMLGLFALGGFGVCSLLLRISQ
ncbi:MAG: PEP-CTERM sorting domain-containing protein [Okeania sp. SIO3B5]|uniref:PEP-CTERM sorting domain-containing protein n=1 Tax=Okeania sp. SIO3B5 TaxID=2607811 RepID=UPI0013FF39DA|nr:PEP-CTERM sorting domain-containing protein [Okeania sp. SIO3B5]NEO54957.1 PEP-CTERM sorting domain-containing protein [Okeania sp. SIO3B5]